LRRQNPTMNKKKIYVVDDTEILLFVAEDALNKRYTVITMDSADNMLKQLQQEKPDLILLDYYMPGMTFHETMKCLKNDEELAKIPVIIMSGSSYSDILDEIYAMGAVDFINKPINDYDALIEKVEKWIK
jgi:twitching motility two-component system response regulator PilH